MLFNKRTKTYKRRKKPKYQYVLFAAVLMTVTLTLGMSVFFKIKTIQITGSSKYTEEEILAASGIKLGKNLMTTRNSSVAAGIKEKLPYIDRVTITKIWPSTLIISVGASPFTAVIEKESGGYYKIGSSGKVLEEFDELPQVQQIEIKGLRANSEKSKIGKTFVAEDDKKVAYGYTLKVIKAIAEAGIEKSVTWLDVTEPGNISFDFNGMFTVEIGTGENIEDKLVVLARMIEDIGTDKAGRIIIKSTENASFVPSQ